MTQAEVCQKLHDIVKAEIGVKEVTGPGSNPRIVVFGSYTTYKATSDAVPWCSSLANYVVDTAGFVGTHSAAARSWLDWGVVLKTPIVGCIVVFDRRDKNNPNAAHVAFCDHADISNGIIRVIGGNQKDSVSDGRYRTSRVLGYRAPV